MQASIGLHCMPKSFVAYRFVMKECLQHIIVVRYWVKWVDSTSLLPARSTSSYSSLADLRYTLRYDKSMRGSQRLNNGRLPSRVCARPTLHASFAGAIINLNDYQ
jgi:hypothetical protein